MAMYTLRFLFTLHIGVDKEIQYRLAAPLIGNIIRPSNPLSY